MKSIVYALAFVVLVALPAEAKKDGSPAAQMLSQAAKANYAGDKKKAFELYGKAIATKQLKGIELSGAYNERGVILTSMNRRKEAIEEFTKAITVAPEQPFYYGNRARTYLTLKEPAKAVEDFTRIIQLKKKPSAFDYADRCGAYAAAKQRSKAIRDCQKSLELRPGYSKAKRLLEKLDKG